MTPNIVFPHTHIILDACCVINLYASGEMEDILRSTGAAVYVSTYVRDEEALSIYCDPEQEAAWRPEPINLLPLIDQGLLVATELRIEAEGEAFIELASQIDDGEAITIAIALARGWTVATDDKKAIRLLRQENPELQVISTLALMKHWTDTLLPSADRVRSALRDIRVRARYGPGADHPLYGWWQRYMGTTSIS